MMAGSQACDGKNSIGVSSMQRCGNFPEPINVARLPSPAPRLALDHLC